MEKKLRGRNLWNAWLFLLAVPIIVYAWSTGPPLGVTGGFGEPTCSQSGCHVGTTVNGGPGSVAISVPSSYTSEEMIPVTVTVSDPDQQRWGFELSARTGSGQQAGTLIAPDSLTQVGTQGGIQYISHTSQGTRNGTSGGVSFNFMWQAPDVSAGEVIFHVAGNAANGNFAPSGDRIYTTSATSQPSTYYFAHIALGAGWQTTFTYINYLTQAVTCETFFFSDSGDPLFVSFGGTAVSSRTDNIPAGGSIHEESDADLNAPVVTGWAQAQCNGPIQASALFRFYQDEVPQSEASVIAMTGLATKFVTFADQITGVAYANPSTETATITFTGKDTQGTIVATPSIPLGAGAHGSTNLLNLPGLESFTGSVTITSSVPIISLSLNFEAAPVFSSLPPGQLNEIAPPPPPEEPPPDDDDDYDC